MCQVCFQTPCHPGCPNAPERPIGRCSRCRHTLFTGDEWAECGDEVICRECLSCMSAREIVEALGGTMHG